MDIDGLLKKNHQDKSKINYIRDLCNKNTLCISLCETFLNMHILDAEIKMEDFTVYRADRTIRIRGGVCFCVSNLFTCKELLSYSNSTCEVLIIEIALTELHTIFMNIYQPPN